MRALGVFFTDDKKLFNQKFFSDKLGNIKKLIDICSSRRLSIYGEVALIKIIVISKFIFVASLLSIPENITKESIRLIYKFLWKGPDKVARVSAINYYERGGIKIIDLECMIKSRT